MRPLVPQARDGPRVEVEPEALALLDVALDERVDDAERSAVRERFLLTCNLDGRCLESDVVAGL